MAAALRPEAMFEREIMVDALKRANGNTGAASRDLETTGRILRYRIQQLGIDPKAFARTR